MRGELEFQKEKKASKKPGRLNMDGRAKLLTSEQVYQGVMDWTKEKEAGEAAVEKRKKMQVDYKKAVKEWQANERV